MAGADHGGDLDRARRRWGDGDWIDLSTGINRVPYPLPELPARVWTDLPTAEDTARFAEVAQRAYGPAPALLPVAGAQAAIQLMPRLAPGENVRVLAPTYNEHARVFTAAGARVRQVRTAGELSGADVAIAVSPNNPTGSVLGADELAPICAASGLVVLDQSFADACPEAALAPDPWPENLVVLRSLGKFYGLAGVRLGTVLGPEKPLARLAGAAGPWAVSGPALWIGRAALADHAWAEVTRRRLAEDARRLDRLAAAAGWAPVGGTPLFRLYQVPDAEAAQARLARAQIWSRIFPWSGRWLRLGLPAPGEWARLEAALG